MARGDIYGGVAPIDVPAYTPAAAAHHLGLPTTTVRYWSLGRDHTGPVILLADPEAKLLSFRNLVELHVLSAVTRQFAVRLPEVRRAVEWLRKKMGSEHPLSDEKIMTDRKHVFIEKFGKLINASAHGQMSVEALLGAYLRRVSRNSVGAPIRLFPFTRREPDGPQFVMIDPTIQFGRPCITGTGVPTTLIVERFKAGDSIPALADDYGRPSAEIEEALRYETELKAA